MGTAGLYGSHQQSRGADLQPCAGNVGDVGNGEKTEKNPRVFSMHVPRPLFWGVFLILNITGSNGGLFGV